MSTTEIYLAGRAADTADQVRSAAVRRSLAVSDDIAVTDASKPRHQRTEHDPVLAEMLSADYIAG